MDYFAEYLEILICTKTQPYKSVNKFSPISYLFLPMALAFDDELDPPVIVF